MKNPKNILITGASSGIGRALAIAYSAQGINLFLCGRNAEKLSLTKAICEELKAIAETLENIYQHGLEVNRV